MSKVGFFFFTAVGKTGKIKYIIAFLPYDFTMAAVTGQIAVVKQR